MTEWVGTAINGGALVVAVGAMCVAIWQAAEARKSRIGAEAAHVSAERSAEASERQAEAAEASFRLQEAQSRGPDWEVFPLAPNRFAAVNNTQRAIVVEEVEVVPDEAKGFVRLGTKAGQMYPPGDRFECSIVTRGYGLSVQRIDVTWRFEDENDTRVLKIQL